MKRKNAVSRLLLAMLFCAACMVAAPVFLPYSTNLYAADNAASDAQLTAEVEKKIRGKNLSEVTVRASDGLVTLSGQVRLYAYKAEAIKKARKVRGVAAVRDNIAVGGPAVPDDVLQQKLLSQIQVDRVGYGQVFNAIGISVKDGVAILSGHALGPTAQQSALTQAEFTPGVRGIINNITVDPVSPMDDGIRIRTFRAIYGFPALRRYAQVPSRPIRISVQNGRVTLYGVVDSEMDKQLAYTRANSVPGVFHVTNDLIVASQAGEKGNK